MSIQVKAHTRRGRKVKAHTRKCRTGRTGKDGRKGRMSRRGKMSKSTKGSLNSRINKRAGLKNRGSASSVDKSIARNSMKKELGLFTSSKRRNSFIRGNREFNRMFTEYWSSNCIYG